MIEAQEIGWLVAFLASEKGRAITGELISPNGGQGNSVYY
jgi:enoyl-[acyl-carrier-protein] reductase (NADH)